MNRRRARPVHRASLVPPLFGGPIGGRRSVYIDDVGLGDETATFNASVEQWRADVAAQMGSLPINFLLMWIQVESNGNPCSWTSLQEAGIFQLMPPDNIAQGGTTMAAQHPIPPCAAGVQTTAYRSSLSDDQAYEQVRGGIQYVNYCRKNAESQLALAGYLGQPGWTDSDWSYWGMVKMWHQGGGSLLGGITGALTGNTQLLYLGMAGGALLLYLMAKRQSRRVAHG
jgi:hypothetical protein